MFSVILSCVDPSPYALPGKGRSHATPISAVVDTSKRTNVDVDADVYDERTSSGGCVPYNTRDRSRSLNSRWSFREMSWTALTMTTDVASCTTF